MRTIFRRTHLWIVLPILPLVFFESSFGQAYFPIGPQNPPESTSKPSPLVTANKGLITKINTVAKSEDGTSVPTILAEVAETGTRKKFPVCNPVPLPTTPLTSTELNHGSMSIESATSVNHPMVNIGTTYRGKVFVRDLVRSVSCLGDDNETRVVYGKAVRMIITISDIDANANLTLPVIAATSTLKNQSNKVVIQVLGFSHPDINGIVASLVDKELNVESYAAFLKATADLIKLSESPQATTQLERIGIVSVEPPGSLSNGVLAGWALTQLSNGKSCTEAKNNFKPNSIANPMVIDSTYTSIMGSCSATSPTPIHKLLAEEQLLGMKVRY